MRRAGLLLLLAGCAAPPARGPGEEVVRPFKIRVDEAVLADLRDRLARTRWPDPIEGSGWTYGVDLAYMKGLVEHWRTSYDWRSAERGLNRFDQFTTRVDGLDLHFIHQRSRREKALPLVITHGWPGSIAEFQKVIGPLTDPEAHGGKAEDAFHVVCPSLPGFGFSGKPREPGWNIARMADAIATLMERLGYARYVAAGGDWGANITTWLGQNDPRVAAIHLNFVGGSPPPGAANPFEGVSPGEKERMERRQKELADHRAYAAIQGTRPLTLGYGLQDSPSGLAAWIVDKFWAWSDHGGDLDRSFTRDELLTNVTIYWVTDSMPSSTRIYFESQHPPAPRPASPGRKFRRDIPVGVALFPKEINVPPRKWVERNLNVVHWTDMPRGGHFAAMEVPDLYVEDVRKFFRAYR